jgi:hypothetical protein
MGHATGWRQGATGWWSQDVFTVREHPSGMCYWVAIYCYWVAGTGLLLGGLVQDPWMTDKVEVGGTSAKHRIWGL